MTTTRLPIVLGTTVRGYKIVTRVGATRRYGKPFLFDGRSDVAYSVPAPVKFKTRQRKITGHTKFSRLVGQRAAHTTSDGQQMIGLLEDNGGAFLIIRFPDGRWARADSVIDLVVE